MKNEGKLQRPAIQLKALFALKILIFQRLKEYGQLDSLGFISRNSSMEISVLLSKKLIALLRKKKKVQIKQIIFFGLNEMTNFITLLKYLCLMNYE